LGTGATYSGTAGAWAAGTYFSATGATSVVGTSGATFYITGVQLEVGSSATGFEYVDYTTQLCMCQRYFYKNFPQVTNAPISQGGAFGDTQTVVSFFKLPVTMRTTPTVAQSGTSVANASVGSPTSVIASTTMGADSGGVSFTAVSAIFAAAQSGYIYTSNTAGFITFSAEL